MGGYAPPPQETLRQPEALLINQWQNAAANRAALPWEQRSFPSLRDVVTPGRPTVLKLAGDLASRADLFFTWDDIRAARSDRNKVHILREAVHVAIGGVVLVLSPNPGPTFDRFWTMLLAPASLA